MSNFWQKSPKRRFLSDPRQPNHHFIQKWLIFKIGHFLVILANWLSRVNQIYQKWPKSTSIFRRRFVAKFGDAKFGKNEKMAQKPTFPLEFGDFMSPNFLMEASFENGKFFKNSQNFWKFFQTDRGGCFDKTSLAVSKRRSVGQNFQKFLNKKWQKWTKTLLLGN